MGTKNHTWLTKTLALMCIIMSFSIFPGVALASNTITVNASSDSDDANCSFSELKESIRQRKEHKGCSAATNYDTDLTIQFDSSFNAGSIVMPNTAVALASSFIMDGSGVGTNCSTPNKTLSGGNTIRSTGSAQLNCIVLSNGTLSGGETDADNPTFTSAESTPADNATSVAVDTNIIAVFSEAVVAQSGANNDIVIKKTSDNSVIETIDAQSAAVTIHGNVVTINPTSDLPAGIEMYINIGANAFDDTSGNSYGGLSSTTAWSFTTDTGDITAPTVSTYVPADNSTDIAVDDDLVLTFSEAVDAEAGVNNNIVIKKASDDSIVETIDAQAAAVTGSGTTAITINPTSDLPHNTELYVQIGVDAFDDAAGNSYAGISNTTTWSFTTIPHIPNTMDNGYTGYEQWSNTVAAAQANDNTYTSWNFNSYACSVGGDENSSYLKLTNFGFTTDDVPSGVVIDGIEVSVTRKRSATAPATTQDETIQLVDGSGTVVGTNKASATAWTTSETTVTYGGSADDWSAGLTDSDVRDLDFGVRMRVKEGTGAGTCTGTVDIELVTIKVYHSFDTTAPTVSTLAPLDNATDVLVDSNLVMTFDETVQAGTGNIVITETGTGVHETIPVGDARVTFSGATVTINPNTDFSNGTAYDVQMAAGVIEDPSGNDYAGITNATTWNFTTDVGDITDPTVSTYAPTDNSTDIAEDDDLVLTFSEAVDAESGGSNDIVIKKASDDSTVETIDAQAAAVSGSGTNTITINPTSDLEHNEEYYVQIGADAFDDAAGNSYAGISNTTTWSFTVIAHTPNTMDNGYTGYEQWSNTVAAAQANDNTYTSWNFNSYACGVGGGENSSYVKFNNFGFSTSDIPSGVVIDGIEVSVTRKRSATAPSTTQDESIELMNGVGTVVGTNKASATNWTTSETTVTYGGSADDWSASLTDSDIRDFDFGIRMRVKEGTGAGSGTCTGTVDIELVTIKVYHSFDTTAPTVSTLAPPDDSTSIVTDTNLVMTFDENVQAGTGNIVITETGTGVHETIPVGDARVTFSGATVTINPNTDFSESTGYDVQMAAGVIEDPSGNDYAGILNATTWNFTTEDTTNPTVSTLSPADNSTDVATSTTLVMTFSEAVDPEAGANNDIVIYKTSDNSVVETIDATAGAVTGGGTNTITITPTSSLPDGIELYVLVGADAFNDAEDNSYAGISSTTAWSFTTIDTTAPTVSTLAPPDNATDVVVDANLVMTFDENVQAGTGNIVITATGTGVHETIPVGDARVTISGTTVTINPNTDFSNGTAYDVQMAAGVIEDTAGNDYAGILNATTWNFTTEVGDVTDPTVSTYSPLDDATDVAIDANLVLTFDENIQAGTGNVVITDDTNTTTFATIPIGDAQITISGATLTINPTSDLANGTDYHVDIDATAIDDLAGNSYAGISSATTWNFTTVAGASSSGANTPNALDGTNPYGPSWTASVSDVQTDDTSYASFDFSSCFGPNSHELELTDFGFTTADVPSGATIDGITVSVIRKNSGGSGNITDSSVRLINGSGTTVGSNKALGSNWSTATNGETVTYGGATDTWSASLTDTDVRDADFGVVITASDGFNCSDTAQIDYVTIEVHYTGGTPDTTPPTVSTLSPTDDATGVAMDSNLVMTFDETVQAGTGNIVITETGTGVHESIPVGDARVTFSGATVTINPNTDFTSLTDYDVQIAAGVMEDAAGNDYAGILNATTWNFTTLEEGVAGPNTPSASYGGSGSSNWTGAVSTVQTDDTSYSEYDFSGCSNSTSEVLQLTNFGFTTSDIPSGSVIDGVLVTVIRKNSGGSGNITDSSVKLIDGDNNVVGSNKALGSNWSTATNGETVTYGGASDTWSAGLSDSDVRNSNFGVEIVADDGYNCSDTAQVDYVTITVYHSPDTANPTLSSSTPSDNATDIAVDANIVLTFNEDVAAGTGNIVITQTGGSVFGTYSVTGPEVSISGDTVTVNPVGNFANSTDYHVTINATAIDDLAGNSYAGISNSTDLNFTTVSGGGGGSSSGSGGYGGPGGPSGPPSGPPY